MLKRIFKNVITMINIVKRKLYLMKKNFSGRIYCDFETESGQKQEFIKTGIKIPQYLMKADDDELIAHPICHVATFKMWGRYKHITTRYFFQFINEFEKDRFTPKTIELFYHNLPFDFSFILWELWHKGYKQIQLESDKLIVEEPSPLKPFTFAIFGDNIKKASAIQICTPNKTYTLIDTFKHYQGSLREWAETYNVTRKGEYNFKGHKLGTNYRKIIKYCILDTIVLFECMEKQLFHYGLDRTPWTSSGASMNNFIKTGIDFDSLFPVLPAKAREYSNFTYHGGICYLNPKFQNIPLSNVSAFDIKSSYPNEMANNAYPVGLPKFVTKRDKTKYGDYLVYLNFKIKGDYHACIRVHRAKDICKGLSLPIPEVLHTRYEYPKEWKGHLIINSAQIKALDLYYDYDMQIINGYEYETKAGIFTDYIINLYKEKERKKDIGDIAGSFTAKTFINKFYGKYGQDLTGINILYVDPYLIQELIAEGVDKKDIKKSYSVFDLNGIYTPVASYTTALAVNHLMQTINADPNNFIYCDTDSVFFHDSKYTPDIGKNLGQWEQVDKNCNNFRYAKFLGKKLYMYETSKGKQVIKAVGMPYDTRMNIFRCDTETGEYNVKKKDNGYYLNNELLSNEDIQAITRDNFHIGAKFTSQKFRPVRGGTMAMDTIYTIKDNINRGGFNAY